MAATIPPISYPTKLGRFMMLTMSILVVHMIEFGVAHFAARWHKKLSAEKGEASLDGGEAGLQQSRGRRMLATICVLVDTHMEFHVRWLSPVVYGVAVGVILG